MDYARVNGYAVFTHDLDFGTLLALTQAESPSVIQVRAQSILPSELLNSVVGVLRAHAEMLERGALIVIDEARARGPNSTVAKAVLKSSSAAVGDMSPFWLTKLP